MSLLGRGKERDRGKRKEEKKREKGGEEMGNGYEWDGTRVDSSVKWVGKEIT